MGCSIGTIDWRRAVGGNARWRCSEPLQRRRRQRGVLQLSEYIPLTCTPACNTAACDCVNGSCDYRCHDTGIAAVGWTVSARA
jgi:hypothetical protein